MLIEDQKAERNDRAERVSTFPRKTSFKREIDAPDYDALKDLKACRKSDEENEKGHNATRYELLQRGAHDAKLIRRDDELWEKFENDPFWIKSYNGGKPRPQKLKRDKKSALRYALIYMLRARTEEAKQLARKYTRSVGQASQRRRQNRRPRGNHASPGKWHRGEFSLEQKQGESRSEKDNEETAEQRSSEGVDWDDPIDIAEKRKRDDRPNNKTKGPIFRWNKRTKEGGEEARQG